ncbi:MAG: ankyrin repeat domain-containing protein [Kitasatospora sp.]|jgi:ankyrin repeat protein|nr:ankyrin repeat domain-containing protein [Kitasatospora sp.]
MSERSQGRAAGHDPELLTLAAGAFDLARQGQTDTLAAYVDAGVPANLSDDAGDTLVMLAADHGHPDTVSALLDRGADPDQTGDAGLTPLADAVVKGEDEVVRTLLEHGADPSAGTPSATDTARRSGRPDLLDLFDA